MPNSYITRFIEQKIIEDLQMTSKAVILYGARQVGKTSLVKKLIEKLNLKTLHINADEARFVDILSSGDLRQLSQLVSGYSLLFIDEAQRVPNIGLNLKILLDSGLSIKIIATGSLSFELANRVSEPLTGRKITYELFPISLLELSHCQTPFELREGVPERLIWGSYPELFSISDNFKKERYLRELTTDYLYRDLLLLAEIRHPEKLRQLLKLLAFQIGNEVSITELSIALQLGKDTVSRYLTLLEKAFIIFHLGGFSKNLRKEVTKMNKYYFYDLGFRNILVDNLSPLSERSDQGALWENFLISERIKRNTYLQSYAHPYFWRVYTGAEIDYIEDKSGKLSAFEFKYGKKEKKVPKLWLETYPDASWNLINQESWTEFVL